MEENLVESSMISMSQMKEKIVDKSEVFDEEQDIKEDLKDLANKLNLIYSDEED